MIKQITVTFDFNTETEEVSGIKVVNTSEKKKTTTKKTKDIVTEIASDSIITLESNKLTFNSKAVADMEIEWEDRIVIKWIKENNLMVPIIGKDIAFDEEGSGNKVTKSNSIAYKGKANSVLANVGNEFTIMPYKEGIWKLISVGQPTTNLENMPIEEAIQIAQEVEPMLLTDSDEETNIDELQFQL